VGPLVRTSTLQQVATADRSTQGADRLTARQLPLLDHLLAGNVAVAGKLGDLVDHVEGRRLLHVASVGGESASTAALSDTAQAMLQENVRVVRSFYDAWARDEFPFPRAD
jgi:hypothetical protein